MSDVVDEVLDIRPGAPLDQLRRAREEARLRSQTSFAALFEPADFGPLSARERYAAAARVAEVSGADGLERLYASARDRESESDPARLEAILAHAEKVGRSPSGSGRNDLARLSEAGLSPAAIVTLSQIIGFVSYQARLVAALSALGAMA